MQHVQRVTLVSSKQAMDSLARPAHHGKRATPAKSERSGQLQGMQHVPSATTIISNRIPIGIQRVHNVARANGRMLNTQNACKIFASVPMERQKPAQNVQLTTQIFVILVTKTLTFLVILAIVLKVYLHSCMVMPTLGPDALPSVSDGREIWQMGSKKTMLNYLTRMIHHGLAFAIYY
jgi:hypothetical protein